MVILVLVQKVAPAQVPKDLKDPASKGIESSEEV